MTRQEYFEVLNGQYIEMAGTDARNQCVDSVNFYIKFVLGLPMIEWTNAVDFPSKTGNNYEWIKNTPDNAPIEGDLIVWGGEWGHIAVCIKATVNTITSFDQNYPTGSPCHVQTHNYNGVKGWLRPNHAIIAQPTAQEFTDQTLIPSLLLTSKDYPVPQALEIQQLRGLLGDYGRLKRDYNGAMAQAHDLSRQLKESNEAYKRLLSAPDGTKTAEYSISELITMLLKKILAKLPTSKLE